MSRAIEKRPRPACHAAAKAKPYLFVAPAVVILAIFWVYPILNMGYLSLFKWDLISPKMQFVGLQNFQALFADQQFWQTFVNTVIYTLFVVGLGVTLGLFVAVYLKEHTKTNGFIQAVIFSPYVVSLASVALLWMWIMNKDYGLLNSILGFFDIGAVDWLGDSHVALVSLILISVWKSVGYDALILVSAIQGIPAHLYEAARLDQASPWTTFRKITLPMISPHALLPRGGGCHRLAQGLRDHPDHDGRRSAERHQHAGLLALPVRLPVQQGRLRGGYRRGPAGAYRRLCHRLLQAAFQPRALSLGDELQRDKLQELRRADVT